jgi:hypothetical protein
MDDVYQGQASPFLPLLESQLDARLSDLESRKAAA